jgi:hypothetical protein
MRERQKLSIGGGSPEPSAKAKVEAVASAAVTPIEHPLQFELEPTITA